MIVSVLAVAFIMIMGFIAYLGYNIIIKKHEGENEPNKEKCSVCRNKFDKEQLLLRQIGDYRLLYFCRECILKLYAELGLKN